MIVAVRPLQNESRGEEAEPVQLGRRRLDVADRHEVDVRVDHVDVLREQVAHRALQLGALRRRPEARWRRTPADVAELVVLQRELLAAAWDLLRPGGVVVYSTCSPHLSETVAVVADAVRRTGAVQLDTRDLLPDVLRALMRDIEIPNGLAAVGYDDGDVCDLVEGAVKQQRLLATAPKDVTEDDLAAILTGSLELW